MSCVRSSSSATARCERRLGLVCLPSAAVAGPRRARPCGYRARPAVSRGRAPAAAAPVSCRAQRCLEPRCSSLAWLHLIGACKLLSGSHPKSVPALVSDQTGFGFRIPSSWRRTEFFFLVWKPTEQTGVTVTPAKPVLGSRKCFRVVLLQVGSYLLGWAFTHVPCIFLGCRWLSKLNPLQGVQRICVGR